MFEIIKLDACPLALMRPSGTPTDRELTETLQGITQFLEDAARQQQRLVMIIDMSKADALRAGQRRIASDWMKHNNARYRSIALSSALVIASPIVRGVLTALLWVQPVDMPYETFGDLDAAVAWAITRLDAERLPVPERLRRELGKAFAARPSG